MLFMVMLVVDDMNNCPAVLDAWDAAGVPGITILESTGMGRMRQASIRDDLPMMPSLRDVLRLREHHHRTLFSVVEGEETVDRIIDITQEVLGDLNDHDTGLLFVLPVARAVGIHRNDKGSES